MQPMESTLTFEGVLPVGDGYGRVHELHRLLELQAVGHMMGHDSCARSKFRMMRWAGT